MRSSPLRCCSLLWLLFLAPVALAGDEPSPEPLRLEEVVVSSPPIVKENRVTRYGQSTSVVSREQIEELAAQNLTSALRRVPGVNISRYNPIGSYGGGDAGAVFIRGLGSGRPGAEVATMIDGIPRFVGVWTHPLVDIMSLDVTDRISVHKSPEPVLFGNMAYGAVDVVTRRRREEGFESRILSSYGSHRTSVVLAEHAGKVEAFDYFMTGSHRESDGHRRNADGDVSSYSARLGYEIDEGWFGSFLFLHTDSWANDPRPEGEPDLPRTERFVTDNEFYLLTLAHDHERAEGHLKLYYEDGYNDWEQWDTVAGEPFDCITHYDNYGFRVRETLEPWPEGEVLLGYDHDVYGGHTREKHPGEVRMEEDEALRNRAPYVLLSHAFGDEPRVIPSVGVRYNDARDFDDEWGWQAGLVAQVGDTTLHASYAHGYNLPGVYAAVRYAGWGLGDDWKDLDAETIDHFELGVAQDFADWLRADVVLFRDEVEDALRFVPPPPPPPSFANLGDYEITGGEASVASEPLKGLQVFAGAAYLDPDPNDVPNAPRWTFVVGLDCAPVPRLSLNLDVEWVDERYVLNPRFTEEQEDVGAYYLVNARVGYMVDLGSESSTLELFLVGENLTDHEYEHRPGYPMPGASVTVGADLHF